MKMVQTLPFYRLKSMPGRNWCTSSISTCTLVCTSDYPAVVVGLMSHLV